MRVEDNKRTVKIGKQGDNGVTEIVFPLDTAFSDCNVSVLVRRPTEKNVYPMECTVQDDGIHVTISAYETDKIGYGAMEVWYTKDDIVKKSTRYETLVSKAIVGTIDEDHDPYQHYFERIVEAGARAEEGADDARGFAQLAKQMATDAQRIKAEMDAVLPEINEEIADLNNDLEQLSATVEQIKSDKMEFYEVAYSGGHIVKDGVIQTYAMLREVFDNTKYWLYLHHIGVNYLPLGASDSVDYLQFNAQYDVTSGVRYESISIDGNNVVTTKFKTFEMTDNKVASVNNHNRESEEKYPSVKAMTSYAPSKADLSSIEEQIANEKAINDARWKIVQELLEKST